MKNNYETVTLTLWGKETEIRFRKSKYRNNNSLYVEALFKDKEYDERESWCALTVNIISNKTLKENEAFLDVNNCNIKIIQYLEKKEYITGLDIIQQSGFVCYVYYPLVKFSDEFLNKIEEF